MSRSANDRGVRTPNARPATPSADVESQGATLPPPRFRPGLGTGVRPPAGTLQARRRPESPAAPGLAAGGPVSVGRLPPPLLQGLEALSGLDLTDVRVHANSPRPAQVEALATAQGSDIHLAPGQERHLPHEAWHVVQQRQGRVRPTRRLGGAQINDETRLEAEADAMGRRALRSLPAATADAQAGDGRAAVTRSGGDVVQRLAFERTTTGMIGGWLGRADTDADVWIGQFKELAKIVERIGESSIDTALEGQVVELQAFVLKYAAVTVPSAERTTVGRSIADNLEEAQSVERELPAAVTQLRLDRVRQTLRGFRDEAQSFAKESKLRKEFRRLQRAIDSFDPDVDQTELIDTHLESAQSLEKRVAAAVLERQKQLEAKKSKPVAIQPEESGAKITPSPGKLEETTPEEPKVESPRTPEPPVWTSPARMVREDKWWANLPDCASDNVERIATADGNKIGQHTTDHRPGIAEAFRTALTGKHVAVSPTEIRMLNGNRHIYSPKRLPALTLDEENSDTLAKVYDYVRKQGAVKTAKYPGTIRRQLQRFPLFDEEGDERGTFKLAKPLVVIVNTLSNNLRKDPGTAFLLG